MIVMLPGTVDLRERDCPNGPDQSHKNFISECRSMEVIKNVKPNRDLALGKGTQERPIGAESRFWLTANKRNKNLIQKQQ